MNNFTFFLRVFLYFFVYIILFIALRHFRPQDVIFYQGNFLILLALISFIFADSRCFLKINRIGNLIPAYFSFSVLAYAFLMTFPVVLDRSITLHMYGYLYKNPGAEVSTIREDFIQGFVRRSGAIEKRVHEQVLLGNLVNINGKIYLSEKGQHTHLLFIKMNDIFDITPTYSN